MYRIDNSTANAALPAPSAAGPNPDFFWSDGNPGGGVPATVVEAEWLNMVQEELRAVILDAGLALDKADRGQLLAALKLLAAPPGKMDKFARNTAPAGWLKANGAAVSRTTYAALFTAIGTTFGVGDGATTFNLPDMRGEFDRGWDDGRSVDTGRVFGSAQVDQLKDHDHVSGTVNSYVASKSAGNDLQIGTSGTALQVATSVAVGGAETRPRNVALLSCIKY